MDDSTDYGKEKQTRPELVLAHFKAHPEALRTLETGFKLDTDEDAAADRHPDENYNIEIADNGDVKITLTHFVQNKATTLFSQDGTYAPKKLSQSVQGPVSSEVKVVATMTIKNASDADLGDKMPEFTIDDIKQEEL